MPGLSARQRRMVVRLRPCRIASWRGFLKNSCAMRADPRPEPSFIPCGPAHTIRQMMRAWCFVLLSVAAVSASTGAAEPRGRSWFEQVERDRDRGAGRIVDDATWETQRLEERRDVLLGRLNPRREFDRFYEERDRELQLETNARRRELGA